MISINVDLNKYPTIRSTIIDTDEGFEDMVVFDATEVENRECLELFLTDVLNTSVRAIINNRQRINAEIKNVYEV